MKFLEQEYYNNSLLAYLIALGIFLILITLLKLFKKVILRYLKKWAEKTTNSIDDYFVQMFEKAFFPLLYFTAFYIAANTLVLHEKIEKFIYSASVVVITFFVLRMVLHGIRHIIEAKIRKQENHEARLKQIKGIMAIINVIIWTLGIIFLLDNFGYNVTAFLTGLGIGGIAIALAAQNILGDLFNYFVIFFDQPFEIGDFIIIDDKMGTVENIGIKTSRIRSLSGEQLIFSNSDLTNSRIHNYKRMEKRRILFDLKISYNTSPENLKIIPKILEDIIKAQENTEFDRAHFKQFGEFSLIIEVVYFVLNPNYSVYMDIQQLINLSIKEKFADLEIEFVYPTQTLFLKNEKINKK